MDRIFVQIASYRDDECQHTVADMFAKAAHPERIFVGICWQYDATTGADHFHCDSVPSQHVRTVNFPTSESQGAGWARAEAQALWCDEEYVLQIHAHTRFEPGWDEKLIGMLARCPSDKAMISTMLPGYEPPNTLFVNADIASSFTMVNQVTSGGNDPQMVHLAGALIGNGTPPLSLKRSPFWVGNFLFSRSRIMTDIPFDPLIYFYGEEITYSARLWTHGYDIFQPDELVLYHWWGRESAKEGQLYKNYSDPRHQLTFKRVKYILRLELTDDPRALIDLHRYDLGTVRTLHSFWKFAGIDITTSSVADFAKHGQFDDAYANALTLNFYDA